MLASYSKGRCSACLLLVFAVAALPLVRADPPSDSKQPSADAIVPDRSLTRLLKYAQVVPLDQLRAALRHENPEVRRLALERWHRQELSYGVAEKPPRERDLQPLFAGLNDPSPKVRSTAARLIGEQRQPSLSAAARLAEMLRTDSADVRVVAATALGRIGRHSSEVHAALSVASREEGPLAAQAILALLAWESDRGFVALRRADDAARLLVAKNLNGNEITAMRDRVFLLLLSDSVPEIRRQTLENLHQGSASRDVVIWQMLNCSLDPDPGVRRTAASNLHGRVELETPEEFERATRLILRMPADDPLRESAWWLVKKPIEDEPGPVLSFLRDTDKDERLRIEVAGVLTRCEHLSDDDMDNAKFADEIEQMALDARMPLAIRVAAAETLCGYSLNVRNGFPKSDDEYEEQFRPLFLEGVKANIFQPMRLMALRRVMFASNVDAAAGRVIDDLFQQEFVQPRATRGSALWRAKLFEAMCYSRPKDMDLTPLLSLGVRGADIGVRRVSAGLLRDAVWNRRYVPDEKLLISLLEEADSETRRAALQAMNERGPKSAAVTTRLLKMLDDSDPWLQREAAFAWKRLGVDVAPMMSRLLERLAQVESATEKEPHSSNANTFKEVLGTLLAVSPTDPRVIAVVLRMLSREESLRYGLMCLPKLGPAGHAALPMLLELLEEPYEQLVSLAAEAVGPLGPVARPALPKLRTLLTDPRDEVKEAAARSVLRLDPTDTAAQDIAAQNIIAEFQTMWCYSVPPNWSCVLSLKRDGLPTLRKVLLSPETARFGSPLESLLSEWGNQGPTREADYLEPLLREFLEESDTKLGERFRASLKRRTNPPR